MQKGLAHQQMLRQCVKHHQWLRFSIHLKTKFGQSPTDSIRLQGPSKRTSSNLWHPVSSVKERNRKGGKCKLSRVLDTYLHIPIHPNSRKYLRFYQRSQVFQFTSLPFGLATTPQVFTMIVKEVKLMALTRGIRLHQYLDNWLIRAQSQEEAQTVLRVDNKSGEVRTKTHSSVFVRGLRIPSRFSRCKTHSRQMAQLQDLILQLKSKHILTARCC